MLGMKGAAIMKRQRNSMLLDWARVFLKHRFDLDVILKTEATEEVQGHLESGSLVGFFADQHPRTGGYNRFTIRELLAPWDQTAHLCGMRFLAPFAVHASLKVVGDADVAPARTTYRRLIEALRDDRLDLDRAAAAENLAVGFDELLARREIA